MGWSAEERARHMSMRGFWKSYGCFPGPMNTGIKHLALERRVWISTQAWKGSWPLTEALNNDTNLSTKNNKQFICQQPDISNHNSRCKTKPKQTKIKNTIERVQARHLSGKQRIGSRVLFEEHLHCWCMKGNNTEYIWNKKHMEWLLTTFLSKWL